MSDDKKQFPQIPFQTLFLPHDLHTSVWCFGEPIRQWPPGSKLLSADRQAEGWRIPGRNSWTRTTCRNSIHASGWKPQKYIPVSQPRGCPVQSALNTTSQMQLVPPHSGQKWGNMMESLPKQKMEILTNLGFTSFTNYDNLKTLISPSNEGHRADFVCSQQVYRQRADSLLTSNDSTFRTVFLGVRTPVPEASESLGL